MTAIVGYAPGIYDMFHVGHLNILKRAKQDCDVLVAGVLSDEMCVRAKGRPPIIPGSERLEILQHIDFVDRVHEEVVPRKLDTWQVVRFDRIFKGDDWRGTDKGHRLEADMASVGVEVVYFPYTVTTSSTKLRHALAALQEALPPGEVELAD